MPTVPPHLPGGRAVGWLSTEFNEWQRHLVKASGGDPSVIKDEPPRFLRMQELVHRCVGRERVSNPNISLRMITSCWSCGRVEANLEHARYPRGWPHEAEYQRRYR